MFVEGVVFSMISIHSLSFNLFMHFKMHTLNSEPLPLFSDFPGLRAYDSEFFTQWIIFAKRIMELGRMDLEI